MADTVQTAFRLTEDDIAALDRIVEQGHARDRTAAVKLAIELAPIGLTHRTRKQIAELAKQADELSTYLRAKVAHDVAAIGQLDGDPTPSDRTSFLPRTTGKPPRRKPR